MSQTVAARTLWTVWIVGLLTYLVAVFHRSSLAVAGLAATERFDITAAQLASFTVLQLLVYAGMQIPVGLLVDRYGSRSVMLTGSALMAVGQAVFALADDFAVAVPARVLIGMGDAMIFICVLRLVARWFPVSRIPFVTQLTGTLGQLGALAAAVPMTLALRDLGWTGAYLIASALGVVVTLLVILVVRDSPEQRSMRGPQLSLTSVRQSLAASWAQPGTRLGFWMHFTTQFSATTLGLLWGYPFLVRGEGLSPALAGTLLSVMVLAMAASGPVLGYLVGRHPWHRSTLVLGIVWAIVVVWTVVLLWPGEAPLPVLILLLVVAGIGGPASMIGFDLGRTSNPADRMASASGIINQGGFSASLVCVLAVGLVLDWRTPGSSAAYTPEAFRWAMSVQYVLWAIGLVQVWRLRRRVRRHIRREDIHAGTQVVT
ncbi:MFS transporter [Alteromonas gracilis]